MRNLLNLLGATALFALAACVGGTTPTASADTMTFAQQVAAFNTKAQADIAAFNANALTDSIAVGKSACGYVSEANGLFQNVATVGAVVGNIDPAVGAAEQGVMIGVNLSCKRIDNADPTQPAAPQVVNAVLQVVAAIPQIKSALVTANPTVAAVATAPVTN
jgi:hypothetical protein